MNSRLVNLVRNWPGWLQVLACHGGWWGASIGMSNAMGKSAHGWTLGARVGVFSHETDPKKIHGSLNVPIEHHPTIRYMVYNGYYKVMSNIPKMGQLPTPKKSLSQLMFLLEMWINGINCNARINGTHSFSFFWGIWSMVWIYYDGAFCLNTACLSFSASWRKMTVTGDAKTDKCRTVL